MKLINDVKRMLLQKNIMLFVITLFSVVLFNPISVSAASFNYKDFDFDTFAEEKKTFWEGKCREEVGEDGVEDCTNDILKSQKKFYTKLYKFLYKYQKKGLYIKDQIILETVFFAITPSNIADQNVEYNKEWDTTSEGIIVDDSHEEDMDEEPSYESMSEEEFTEYMKNEKDTLKVLIKNMIAYPTICYGIMSDVRVEELNDGSTIEHCDNGGIPTTLNKKYGRKCAVKRTSNELGYWKYHISKWAHDGGIIKKSAVFFIKQLYKDEYYEECEEAKDSYPDGTAYVYDPRTRVSEQMYFDWLIENKYFDQKKHLQYRFEETVLKPAGVKCMSDDICDNSLESAGLYETYINEIYDVRREIVKDIVKILRDYGIEVGWENGDLAEYIDAQQTEAARKSYYWPIGSDETEERNGVIFADGEPASTDVVSAYGYRTNEVTGEKEYHYGIDIAGVDGVTNVVAVYSGEVVEVVNSCTVGDYDCNDGLGNMVIISHSNGDYTVYAHMSSIESNIVVGAGVLKGQLLGKVGMTGRTKKAVLHYELRKGGNSVTYSDNPLENSDPSNPRPAVSAGDFSVRETSLTRNEFIAKLQMYCSTHSCKSAMQNVFVPNAGLIYDVAVSAGINPEMVVVRAMSEGFSPGGNTNNYWGVGCANNHSEKCKKYGTFEEGIRGFASVISKYNTASEMMSKYAYIGAYWYNPGSSSNGGCYYFPHIRQYLSPARDSIVAQACNGPSCPDGSSGPNCTKTTSEDQTAYATWQVANNMGSYRYNVFGL